MSKTILITGGSGFIGHHLVEHLLIHSDWICLVPYLDYMKSELKKRGSK